jgi:hypothetical protein
MSEEDEEEISINDELETNQYTDDGTRKVHIILDDHENEMLEVQLIINDEGKWQLNTINCGASWSPSYHFSKVGGHVRLTQVSEHCNMIPPDFAEIDIVGMTPTMPNEGFRTRGIKDFKSDYRWNREAGDWVIINPEE